jgi:isopentenyl-diphosphate delta-isomerase
VPEEPLVELVDDAGRTIGTMPKLAAHQAPGTPHRAISVFLFDLEDRLLLQQRAVEKYHSGGLWSNTCCGHPLPGERPRRAALRRLRDELGVVPELLEPAGTVRYHVVDDGSGLVESEWNHLFVGRFAGTTTPDPREVGGCRLVPLDELDAVVASDRFTPWFGAVLDAARPALRAAVSAGIEH